MRARRRNDDWAGGFLVARAALAPSRDRPHQHHGTNASLSVRGPPHRNPPGADRLSLYIGDDDAGRARYQARAGAGPAHRDAGGERGADRRPAGVVRALVSVFLPPRGAAARRDIFPLVTPAALPPAASV